MPRYSINLLRRTPIFWDTLTTRPSATIRRLQDKLLFGKLTAAEEGQLARLYDNYFQSFKAVARKNPSITINNTAAILSGLDKLSLYLITLQLASQRGSGRVQEVRENQIAHVIACPGEPTKIIWTHRLTGCSVVLVTADCPDGSRIALMTHYNPTFLGKHLIEIDSFFQDRFNLFKQATNKRALLLLRSDDAARDCEPGDFELLEIMLEKHLGDDLLIKRKLYFSDRQEQAVINSDYGSIAVKVPPVIQGTPTYRTWYGEQYPGFVPIEN